jgi:hypothetical protein
MPKRITTVRLITVSILKKVEGKSQFGDVALKDGAKKQRI